MKPQLLSLVPALALLGGCSLTAHAQNPAAPRGPASPPPVGVMAAPDRFSYRSEVMQVFLRDSVAVVGATAPEDFYRTMDRMLSEKQGRTWDQLIDENARKVREAKDRNARTLAQAEFGRQVWRGVKDSIRKFDLDRGFEFANVTKTGERQCFLQSIIVASVLQAGGVDAGVAMVWRNPKGQPSVIGHATAVARLSDGTDLILDCSDPVPTVTHQGLFLRTVGDRDYRFVAPIFRPDGRIEAYRVLASDVRVKPFETRFLDIPWLRSQFEVYRSERVPSGYLSSKPQPAALAKSAEFLARSRKESEQNPLAVYMEIKMARKLNQTASALQWKQVATEMFGRMGWTPSNLSEL